VAVVFAISADEIGIATSSRATFNSPWSPAIESLRSPPGAPGAITPRRWTFPVKCWLLAPLEGGRLALALRPDDPTVAPFSMVSTDGGRSFGPRHDLPAALFEGTSCPGLATDGRALYFFIRRPDGTVGFLRGAQPGTTCR
jgi:hypothetical protein